MVAQETLKRIDAAAQSPGDVLRAVCAHLNALRQDTGDWNLSIYDMAWVLCCGFFPSEEQSSHIEALLAMQNEDGSWGDDSYVPHSALVDTLAVLMCLVRLKRAIPRENDVKGLVAELLAKCSKYPFHDTVGFELIVPNLMRWLREHGVVFDLDDRTQAFVRTIEQKCDYKLSMLRSGPGLFSASLTLSYTAEVAAFVSLDAKDIERLPSMMLQNGAIGLSPAATAAVIIVLQEQQKPVNPLLFEYLRNTYQDYHHKGFPDLHPALQTRRLWTILPWLVSGDVAELVKIPDGLDIISRLYLDVDVGDVRGVSWDVNNKDLPDLDDTAVALAVYYVLKSQGVKDLSVISPKSLLSFQRKDGSFFCYPYELHPSPAALIHSLMAMEFGESLGGTFFAEQPENRSIVDNLLAQLAPEGQSVDALCHDKWHATWTYGAQRWLSLKTFQKRYPGVVRRVLEKVLAEERPGGGWGQRGSTLEETAYVVSGLVSALKADALVLSEPVRRQGSEALDRARSFFLERIGGEQNLDFPPIWISKNLYHAKFQIVSAVSHALYCLSTFESGLKGARL